MIETFKEMVCKIKGEIDMERREREEEEEKMLNNIEEVCVRIAEAYKI